MLFFFPFFNPSKISLVQRFAAIGQFYFPDGVPLLPDTQLKKRVCQRVPVCVRGSSINRPRHAHACFFLPFFLAQDLIANVFRAHGDHGGIRAVDFHAATRAVCDLPSYCSAALFLKLQPLCPHAVGIVTHDAFMQCDLFCFFFDQVFSYY